MTKRTPRVIETPHPRYQVEAEVVNGEEYYEGSEEEYDDVRELDEGSNSHIHQLSYGNAGIERGQVMEIRTPAPLDKIAKFEGKRYRSDDALQ